MQWAKIGSFLAKSSSIMNFTIAYLDFVAREIVGLNSTVFSALNNKFPLEAIPESVPSTTLPEISDTAQMGFHTAIRSFFADVFEGQILLSILILMGITLLCIKEYIVLNTPVDARGNPVDPLEEDANVVIDANDFPLAPPQAARNPLRPGRPNLRNRMGNGDLRGFRARVEALAAVAQAAQQPIVDVPNPPPPLLEPPPEPIPAPTPSLTGAQTERALAEGIVGADDQNIDVPKVKSAESISDGPKIADVGPDFEKGKAQMGQHQPEIFEGFEQARTTGVGSSSYFAAAAPGKSDASSPSASSVVATTGGTSEGQSNSRASSRRGSVTSAGTGGRSRSRRGRDGALLDLDVPLALAPSHGYDLRSLSGRRRGSVASTGGLPSVATPLSSDAAPQPQSRLPSVVDDAISSTASFGTSSVGSGTSPTVENLNAPQVPQARAFEFVAPVTLTPVASTGGGGVLRDIERAGAERARARARMLDDESGDEDAGPGEQEQAAVQERAAEQERAPAAEAAPAVPERMRRPFEPFDFADGQQGAGGDDPNEGWVDVDPAWNVAAGPPAQAPAPARAGPGEVFPARRMLPLPPPARRNILRGNANANNNNNNNNNNRAIINNNNFNVNVNVEFGPDGLAAEVQAQGDMNAFLELVGIRGPLDLLVQNFAIAVAIVFAAIGTGHWAPSLIGRTVWWLFLDVYYPLVEVAVGKGTHFLQGLTDPVLDPVVDGILVLVAWAGILETMKDGSNVTMTDIPSNITSATTAVNEVVPAEFMMNLTAESVVQNTTWPTVNSSESVGNLTLVNDQVDLGTWESVNVSVIAAQNISNGTIEDASRRLQFVSDDWTYLITGYICMIFVAYQELRRSGRLSHPYVRTMKRLFRQSGRFLMLAMKFAFFITIELGIFPTFCGILIDGCTLTVFGPTTSLQSRIMFYKAYPWTSYFLHWLAGTTFMFQFAAYVQSVRKIVRPGVVWFIRDPEDPQFHPMQDIIEKPTLTQLRKLVFGAFMYAIVVIGTVGGYVAVIEVAQRVAGATAGPARVFPLKWEFSEPLSEFPIDMLIFHFVVPAVYARVKPKELVVGALAAYFRVAARWLRLSQFMLGVRAREEENGEVGEDDPVVIKLFEEHEAPPGNASADNAHVAVRKPYMRVPTNDRIPLKPGVKVMMPMARDDPLVGRADENEDDIRANWTRVYVPNLLRVRLVLFMAVQWILGVVCAVVLSVVPLIIGRMFFVALHKFFTSHDLNALAAFRDADMDLSSAALNSTVVQSESRRVRIFPSTDGSAFAANSASFRSDLPVHDLFSFSLGFLIEIGLFAIGLQIFKVVRELRNQVRSLYEDSEKSAFEKVRYMMYEVLVSGLTNTKTYAVIIFKVCFVGLWVGVIIPILLGLLFELYVVIPLVGHKPQTRVFFILQDWALGAIYTKVTHSIIMNAPNNIFRRALVRAQDQHRQGGLAQVELRPIALKVLLPFVLLTCGLVFLPSFVFYATRYLEALSQPRTANDEPAPFAASVRGSLAIGVALVVLYETLRALRKSVRRWMDVVRDEHYLVGRRLRNLGDAAAAVEPNSTNGGGARVDVGNEGE
ncbi:hypothetical protein HDU83_004548 [Entophlyctis luteolus]|nr:hypothetical protein HDU83_004548 [Entophlyctis luteolus]